MDDFQFLIYRSAEEGATVKAVIKDDTIWLTISQIALLFDKEESNLRRHIRIFLTTVSFPLRTACKKCTLMASSSPSPSTTWMLSSPSVTESIPAGLHISASWATGILKEYMTKGFVLDDERLKQGKDAFGKDYFRELLERVRSIRASERRIWQQVTDIFAECCIDYDRNSPTTKEFYAMVQNKFHYAITGQTAAEIVYSKADHTKEHMGLSTWKNAPEGRVLKSDVSIAKNYLSEKQIRQLERTVSGYFDYIEDLIERENTFTMEQFAASINEFLSFRRYDILPDKGKISARQAKEKAEAEYDLFNPTQKIVSDFDKVLKQLAP